MKLLRFAVVALLAGGMLVACDDDEQVVIQPAPAPVTPVAPPPPAPIVGSVGGTVSVEGSGLGGVTVGLVGAASQTATTGDSGGYSFSNVPGGTHGVQISGFPAEVAFVSTSSVVTIATTGQTVTADFGGNYIRTSTITGTVTAGGEGVVATVTATGAGMLMSEEPVAGSSNPDGDFQLGGLRAGTYHVTISDFGDIEFAVTTRDVTVGVGLSANVSFSAPGADPGTDSGAFIFISDVESAADAGADAHEGRVTVTASVERGEARFEKIALYVDGNEVDSQSFGVPASEPADEPETGGDPAMAAAQVFEFKLGFNSADYDEDTGVPTYTNGDHELQVGLKITGSESELFSNLIEAEFDNDDGFIVTADLGDNYHLSGGKRWNGGPDNGAITITALPVSYSGGSVSAVTVNFCGDDEDGAQAEGASAYSAEFACKGHTSGADGDDVTITAGGEDGNILNEVASAYIDNAGPTNPPTIIANRNGRQNGWVNSAVGLAGKFDAKDAKDNWLVAGADESAGVGGYNMAVQIGKDLEAAVGDDATSSLPAESADRDSYCAVAVASDDLGNMAGLPDADDDTCREAPPGSDVLLNHDQAATTPDTDGELTPNVWAYDSNDDGDDQTVAPDDVSLAGQTLQFGVDTTNPVVELGAKDYATRVPVFADSLSDGVAFEVADDESNVGNSDLHSDDGLMVKAQRRSATKTECITIGADGTVATDAAADKDCEYTAIPVTSGTAAVTLTERPATPVAEEAFWTVSGMAQDQAGNSSTVVSHAFAYDRGGARATAPAVPGIVAAGKPFVGATYLNDGLSIRDYYGTMSFGGDVSLGIGLPVAVDAFNAATLTNVNHAVTSPVGIVTASGSIVDPYAALQTDVADAPSLQLVSGVTIAVRDQAQAAYTAASTPDNSIVVTGAPADTLGFRTSDGFVSAGYAFEFPGEATTYTVCGYAKCEKDNGDDLKSTVKIEVVATAAAAGTFRDPFERVDFWMTDENGVAWLVGSDGTGTSGRVGGDGNDARFRTWSYSVTLPGITLRMLTRPGIAANADADTGKILAIGLNESGVGLSELMGTAIAFGTEDEEDDN